MNPNEPNIINMVISSILDSPEDWTIEWGSSGPTIHVHKSGIGIWAYLRSEDVKFWKPEYAKAIQISKEEKKLLFNAIEKDRIEKGKKTSSSLTKRFVKQFTAKSWFRKLFS